MPVLVKTRKDYTRSPETVAEYIRIAENWLKKHIDASGNERTPKVISDTLVAWSDDKRPGTFRKMRSALIEHQGQHGFRKSVERIQSVERKDYDKKTDVPKRRRCKTVKQSEHEVLLQDAINRDDRLMVAALHIAYKTGSRPAEMPTMQWVKHPKNSSKMIVKIIGAKKNEQQKRGMDKHISLDCDPDLARAIDTIRGADKREMTNLKKRVSRRSHAIYLRRKNPPTLYSYRHQLGSDVKAGIGDRRKAAAIMGHASQKSIQAYGHANAGGGLDRNLPAVAAQSIQAVDPTPGRDPVELEKRARSRHQRFARTLATYDKPGG